MPPVKPDVSPHIFERVRLMAMEQRLEGTSLRGHYVTACTCDFCMVWRYVEEGGEL